MERVCVRERERFRYCCVATLGLPPPRSTRSDSAASDLFYHVTSTDTCSKAHAHTRPYRKCIISIDLYCSHRCYSYKISHLSQSKTKTYWCTVRTAPTPYLLTSLPCHTSLLCSSSNLSQACSTFHLSLFTGLFYAPSVTCHSSVLCPICHFSQASSMPHLSLVTGLFYAPSVTFHRPVLCSICYLFAGLSHAPFLVPLLPRPVSVIPPKYDS